ncbi:septum formation initiator family protein [Desulfococcaceae bacterium HSG7]|nr:septum formation initiator family protein [Desulfococcaceae bacterium HSG7]
MIKYRQSILIAAAILLAASLVLFIAYGHNGLVELNFKKIEKTHLIERNKMLEKKILSYYREIERLKNDLEFLKMLAKHELGWVEKDEVIFKIKSSTSVKQTKNPAPVR